MSEVGSSARALGTGPPEAGYFHHMVLVVAAHREQGQGELQVEGTSSMVKGLQAWGHCAAGTCELLEDRKLQMGLASLEGEPHGLV
jgi:hypothetical protein